MRRRHSHRRGKNHTVRNIVISCFVIMLLLATGYSAFQTVININVRGNIKINKECIVGKTWEYTQKDEGQEFRVPCSGNYKVELWGAGGNPKSSNGKGGYVSGKINFKMNKKYYVYVGEYPIYRSSSCYTSNPNNSFNGNRIGSCSGGGGATDIRTVTSENWYDFVSLSSRIIVAGGGGGQIYDDGYGGAAGGLIGYNGFYENKNASGGTQISSSFGIGTRSTCTGGGGYYGGIGVGNTNAGGGSSFISGHEGCDAISEQSTENNIIHTGQSIHYSGLYFTDTIMIDGAGYKWTDHKLESLGVVGMPTHDGTGTMTGNEGDGFAKITLVART